MISAELAQAIGFLLVVGGAVGTIYWRWSSAVGGVDKDLQSYKLHVAETFATKKGVSEQLGSVTKSVEAVGDRVDKRFDTMSNQFTQMNERLDRVIEAQHTPRRRNPG